MNDLDRTRVHHAANTEAVKRILIKYFKEHCGFNESFDKAVNPVTLQDMPFVNLELQNKIEIEPHAVEVDPTTSRATLGWNLFVLGNQRMYLGETYHANLLDLARQIKTGFILPEATLTTKRCTTPRRIINFIERVLSNSQGGMVDLAPQDRQMSVRPRPYRPMTHPSSQEAQFYSRSFNG